MAKKKSSYTKLKEKHDALKRKYHDDMDELINHPESLYATNIKCAFKIYQNTEEALFFWKTTVSLKPRKFNAIFDELTLKDKKNN